MLKWNDVHYALEDIFFYGGSTDTDIRHGGTIVIRFQASHVYFFVGEWPKSIVKLEVGPICPLDPPLALCLYVTHCRPTTDDFDVYSIIKHIFKLL